MTFPRFVSLVLATLVLLVGCEGTDQLPLSPSPSSTVALRISEAPPGFLEATESVYIRATTGAGRELLDSVFAFRHRTGIPLTLPSDQSLELLVQGFDASGILFWSHRSSIPPAYLGSSIPIRALPLSPTLDSSGVLIGRTEPIRILGGRLDDLGYLIPDAAAQYIMVSSPTATATIRYTTDGTAPSWSSPMVEGPILINPGYTFRFIAMAPRMFPSTILQVFIRESNPCNCYIKPFRFELVYPIDPGSGTFLTSGAYQVILRKEYILPNEVVRFTKDGTDPDWASAPMPDSLAVTESFRLKAAVFRGLDRSSEIVDTLLPFGSRAN